MDAATMTDNVKTFDLKLVLEVYAAHHQSADKALAAIDGIDTDTQSPQDAEMTRALQKLAYTNEFERLAYCWRNRRGNNSELLFGDGFTLAASTNPVVEKLVLALYALSDVQICSDTFTVALRTATGNVDSISLPPSHLYLVAAVHHLVATLHRSIQCGTLLGWLEHWQKQCTNYDSDDTI